MILGALYGARRVAQTVADDSCSLNVCLYFSHSDFFKHRSRLDGVMALDSGRAELHLNDHSPRVARMRASRIALGFSNKNALRDASGVARLHGYLIADCSADRNREDSVCRYLESKYKLRRVVRMHSLEFDGIEFVACDAD